MSGAEVGIVAIILANAGTIMPIFISVFAIIGSIVGFIRYLKKNVTQEVVGLRTEVNEKFNSISDKILDNQNTMKDNTQRIVDRMGEIKQMMTILDERITEVKNDTSKRLDFKRSEIQRLQTELDSLRHELQRLEIESAKNDRRMDRHGLDTQPQDYSQEQRRKRRGPPIDSSLPEDYDTEE